MLSFVVQKILDLFPLTRLIKERLEAAEKTVTKLEAQIATLKQQLENCQVSFRKEHEQHNALKATHEEDTRIWAGLEFRCGRRTFWRWSVFCPGCHIPVVSTSLGDELTKPICKCGIKGGVTFHEISEFLEHLEKEFPSSEK